MSTLLTGHGAILGTLQIHGAGAVGKRDGRSTHRCLRLRCRRHEMLTGTRASAAAVRRASSRRFSVTIPSPSGRSQPLAPPALERAIAKCLTKDSIAVMASNEGPGSGIAALDGSGTQRLLTDATRAIEAPPGVLLFVRGNTLFAQRFTGGVLAGRPVLLARQVASASASGTGLLAYRTAPGLRMQQLTWFNRAGRIVGNRRRPIRRVRHGRTVAEWETGRAEQSRGWQRRRSSGEPRRQWPDAADVRCGGRQPSAVVPRRPEHRVQFGAKPIRPVSESGEWGRPNG